MNKEVKEELLRIREEIDKEQVSYGELAYLESHEQDILELGDIVLAQWGGITEAEWNAGKLRMSDKEMFEFIEETLKKSVSEDYAHALALVLFEDVKQNIEETSDVIEVNDTDVKDIIGKVLYERLHVWNSTIEGLGKRI